MCVRAYERLVPEIRRFINACNNNNNNNNVVDTFDLMRKLICCLENVFLNNYLIN